MATKQNYLCLNSLHVWACSWMPSPEEATLALHTRNEGASRNIGCKSAALGDWTRTRIGKHFIQPPTPSPTATLSQIWIWGFPLPSPPWKGVACREKHRPVQGTPKLQLKISSCCLWLYQDAFMYFIDPVCVETCDRVVLFSCVPFPFLVFSLFCFITSLRFRS